MLIYFKVGNFKSIKEPVVINFTASSISEHRDTNVSETKRHSLLRTALLYGHNASGKSKLLDAVVVMRWIILYSAAETQAGEPFPIEPFLLDQETATQPSFFEASFCLADQTYRYGFEADSTQIQEEWLFEVKGNDEIPLFLRRRDEVQTDPRRFENATGLEKRMRNNALFLSVASQWNVQKAEQILNWFRTINIVSSNDNDYYKRTTLDLMKNAEMAAEVMEFIRRADVGIDAIAIGPLNTNKNRRLPETFNLNDLSGLEAEELPDVFTSHQQFDAKGNLTGNVQFVMERQESKGTVKFFNLIGLFIRAIKENRLVIVDEIDARFHSLLTKAIIRLFNSGKDGCTAQLLAATHDTALLDRDLLRRDQIWFVEKNKYGASKLTSLAEYKVRKEAPYDKNYLEGRFGAIPFIEEFESILKHA